MASSSSSAHRLLLDLEPAQPAESARCTEVDRLSPAENMAAVCQYFGDDAPTIEVLLPTTVFQLPAPTEAPAATPMARLRLQRRPVKRDIPGRDED
jgi:hypothetical protein